MSARQRRARRARAALMNPTDNVNNPNTTNITSITSITTRNQSTPSNEESMTPESTQSYVVGPPPAPKKTILIENVGAHRGARLNVPAYAGFNGESTSVVLSPVYIDPQPGRALALKEEAERQGVPAGAIDARAQELTTTPKARVFNVDRASALADALRSNHGKVPTLGYLLVKSDRLWGLRFVLQPEDRAVREAAIAFFDELASVSERAGSEAVLGEHADPGHVLMEPLIREWFARHTRANLGKLVAGLEPESSPMELTVDGNEAWPVVVVVRDMWSDDPISLARDVVARPPFPLPRTGRSVVAEVVRGQGIRLHEVWRRTDGKITVNGAEVVDRASEEARIAARSRAVEAAREEERRRQAAVARAERAQFSMQAPVWTTD